MTKIYLSLVSKDKHEWLKYWHIYIPESTEEARLRNARVTENIIQTFSYKKFCEKIT